MSRETLEVLIVEGEESVTDALSSTLEERGHRVSTAASAEGALALPAQDVIVCEGHLPGSSGFELLSAVKQRGDAARFVILLGDPTVDECLRALRLGANDLLAKPFRVEDLVRAVEHGGRRSGQGDPAPKDSSTRDALDRSYPPSKGSIDLCARELCAFAILHGVPPSVRARIACAAEEIVHNAIHHGRLAAGSAIHVQARIRESIFQLRIADPGSGFEPGPFLALGRRGPARTGLQRVVALSESLHVRSSQGAGTEIDLRFSIAGADLSGEGRDLSEVDFLALGEAEALIGELLLGRTPDIEALSPALAVVLGRLLAGPERAAPEAGRTLP